MIVWKVVIDRVTVIKFRMDNGGGNGAGCFEVEIWADTAKLTNMIVAGFRKCRDLVGEGNTVHTLMPSMVTDSAADESQETMREVCTHWCQAW